MESIELMDNIINNCKTGSELDTKITENDSKIVCILFYMKSNSLSRNAKTTIENLAVNYPQMVFILIEFDKFTGEVSAIENISNVSVPTLILLFNSSVIGKYAGISSRKEIE